MLRLLWHYVLAQAFHKAGPDIEKALDPVLVFIKGTTNQFELVERRYSFLAYCEEVSYNI